MIMIWGLFLLWVVSADDSVLDYKLQINCNDDYFPINCGFPNTTLDNIVTVEDFDRCAPAVLPMKVRNLYLSGAGRKVTYARNFEALRKEHIIPRILRDLSNNDLQTTVLGANIQFPVGISPTAVHKLANPGGEAASARAAAKVGAVFVLSSYSQTSIEEVAEAAFSVNSDAILWMQTYIFKNRDDILHIVQRAEQSGFRAFVVTVDSPIPGSLNCNGREIYGSLYYPNLQSDTYYDGSITFKDLTWLKDNTKLPIVAKGVLTGADAVRCAQAGASAIFVSNQGGRQLDGVYGTMEVLPEVVNALRHTYPNVEVYMDGGVRNGWDVFKVLAKGAKAAFVGRPALWGLAIDGDHGVEKMLTILRTEFNESMIVAGYANPREILEETKIHSLIPVFP